MPNGQLAQSRNVSQHLGKTHLKNAVVFDTDFKRLNVLDRIARYVLAAAYSSAYSGTDTYNQAYVAARTVAVALSGTSLYIAANSLFDLRSESKLVGYRDLRAVGGSALMEAILEENIVGTDESNIFFVSNRYGNADRNYHAEMQLVDELSGNGLPFTGDQIGVSKPCCQRCAEALDKLGIEYSYWHTQNVGISVPCRPATKWW